MTITYHMTQDELLAAVTEPDQALYTHEQWTEGLYAALVCHLHADDRDLSSDSYRKCRFGQWYYASRATRLSDRPGFAEVEIEHKRLHQYASNLLQAYARGMPISLPDYERFVSAL